MTLRHELHCHLKPQEGRSIHRRGTEHARGEATEESSKALHVVCSPSGVHQARESGKKKERGR